MEYLLHHELFLVQPCVFSFGLLEKFAVDAEK